MVRALNVCYDSVRVDYTSGDDRHLVEYLTENSGEPRFGNTIYRRLVEDVRKNCLVYGETLTNSEYS